MGNGARIIRGLEEAKDHASLVAAVRAAIITGVRQEITAETIARGIVSNIFAPALQRAVSATVRADGENNAD